MKKIFLFFLFVIFSGTAFSQTPAQIIWRNGSKDGDVITLKDASEGIELKSDTRKQVKSIYVDSQAQGSVGIECSFVKNDIEAIGKGAVSFEVKWYYYMSTRKSLVGTNTVTLDTQDSKDGIIKFVCMRDNVRSGWWEVKIKNKTTGEIIKYANQDSYQICFN